jgi:hypothetical protein
VIILSLPFDATIHGCHRQVKRRSNVLMSLPEIDFRLDMNTSDCLMGPAIDQNQLVGARRSQQIHYPPAESQDAATE